MMIVKKLSIFLSIFVVLHLGLLAETASAFSLCDLSDFCVEPMKVVKAGPASIDGMISDGEYGEGSSFCEGNGIYFLDDDQYQNSTISSGATQENYVSISGNYVY